MTGPEMEVHDVRIATGLSEKEMDQMLSCCPAGLCLLLGRVIQWANPALHDMLGRAHGSLKDQDAAVLYPTPREFLRVGVKMVDEVAAQGTALAETRLLRADGTAFDCRVRVSRMGPDPESPLLLVITDITELKSRQTARQQAQKMEAIGVLAGGISHDFNNLLMGIQGHLSLMRIHVEMPDRISAHIQQITQLVKTAADLTARLLGFARGGKYQISVLDINQVAAVALNIFKPEHEGVRVVEDLEPLPLAVDGDHSQLEQVVLNLLVNAAQAMVETGTLWVITRKTEIRKKHGYPFEVAPGPYAQIIVKDEGIGMDEETRKRVFDPFFSTKEIGNQKGRGLGLSTVYGIVKNHGGFITVDSVPGKGSQFCVSFPCSPNPLSMSGDAGENGIDQIPKGSETILFVDDEEEILLLGKRFLEKLGYRTMVARNGLEAVEIYRIYHNEISLVVLDLVMPILDGRGAFMQMQQIRPDVKVLVSTGFTVDQEVETILKQGCHGFLQKPFSMHRFSRAIREILDSPPPG